SEVGSTPPFIGIGPLSLTDNHPTATEDWGTIFRDDADGPVDTVWKGWQRTVRLAPNNPCYGIRPYVTQTAASQKQPHPSPYLLSADDGLPVRSDYVWSTYAEIDQ